MRQLLAFLLLLLGLYPAQAGRLPPKKADTLHALEVKKPEGKGPFPLLVIAPALKYDAKQEIFEKLARAARQHGYYVVRFQWDFFVKGEAPSTDLSKEAAQLSAVISKYADEPDVDASRIILAAKSFGVKVAMRGPEKSAAALLLITPNCDEKDTFRKAHAPLFKSSRPVHIIISSVDPYCDVRQIREAAKDLGIKTDLNILGGGDHNFKLTGPHPNAAQDAAIASMLAWLIKARSF